MSSNINAGLRFKISLPAAPFSDVCFGEHNGLKSNIPPYPFCDQMPKLQPHPPTSQMRSPSRLNRLAWFPGTPNCPGVATTCASLIFRQRTLNLVTPMPTVMVRAATILGEFEHVQAELVGTAVMLTDGKAGTVETVWLDELHGLLISIRGHDGKWPISTVKLAETR